MWRGYDYRQKKKEAKAAYDKLAPDAELHARIMAAAIAWQQSWAAQGKQDAPRFTLAKWLEREEYECDPPTAYKPKELKAKPPAKVEPANDNVPPEAEVPDYMKGHPSLWPVGEYCGEFVEGNVDDSTGDHEVTLSFLVVSPEEHIGDVFEHRFFSQACIKSYQEEGQKIITDIVTALGMSGVTDTDELLFKPLRVRADGKKLTYLKEAA